MNCKKSFKSRTQKSTNREDKNYYSEGRQLLEILHQPNTDRDCNRPAEDQFSSPSPPSYSLRASMLSLFLAQKSFCFSNEFNPLFGRRYGIPCVLRVARCLFEMDYKLEFARRSLEYCFFLHSYWWIICNSMYSFHRIIASLERSKSARQFALEIFFYLRTDDEKKLLFIYFFLSRSDNLGK